jgi:hypothetical protein
VAAKVHFTNNMKEMEEFITPNHILKELDGQEDWDYEYIEPVPGENDKMKDTETRDRKLAAREELIKQYEEATLRWIRDAGSEKGAEVKAERNSLATRLREDYWALDPYLRARSLYDRAGMLQVGGKVDWYPAKTVEAPANGIPTVVETSADDVD